MTNLYRLKIDIDEASPPEGAIALLVPVPPTTPHQTLEQVVLDPSWKALPVAASGGVQSALHVTFPDWKNGSSIVYEMTDSGCLDQGHFKKAQHANSCTSFDAYELAERLGIAECECETERIEKIVGSLASKFQYQSGFANHAPLTCDILTGNCLSINDAFLKLTDVAGIPSAYYIGYFFESDETLESKDWHCWVSTLTPQGFDSWDIAHHLKRGMKEIRPALNPVAGIRFATGVGRKLEFQLPTGKVSVPHLCEPRWVLRDGGSRPCEIRISLRGVSAASGATPSEANLTAALHAQPSRNINQHLLPDAISAQ